MALSRNRRIVAALLLTVAGYWVWCYVNCEVGDPISHSFEVYEAPELVYIIKDQFDVHECAVSRLVKRDLPTNDSRALIDLHDFHFTINPGHCDKNLAMVTLVHSSAGNVERRQLIRDTWGSVLKGALFFMVGRADTSLVQASLEVESARHKDLVQGDFKDTYRNLTYKSVMSLKWAVYFCPEAPYVLRIDDDMFANTPLLLKALSQGPAACGLEDMMICRVYEHNQVYRNQTKWAVKPSEFAGDYYPQYCNGIAVLYSKDMVYDLYLEAQRTRYFWLEDVFVTGIVANKLNKTRQATKIVQLALKAVHDDTRPDCGLTGTHLLIFGAQGAQPHEIKLLWHYVNNCAVI